MMKGKVESKMKKRGIALLLLVLLLMVQMLCPAMADQAECNHKWNDVKVLKAGSCTTKGIIKQECELCKKTQYTSAYAHHFEETAIEATCTEPAKVGEKCTVCGAVGEAEVVEGSEALGHDLVLDEENEKYVAATCEEGGHDTFKCSRCDYTEEKGTEALGHKWDDGEYVDADCENGAGVKYTCVRCEESYVEELDGDLAVPALGHKEEAADDIPATCKEPGLTGKIVCSVCGKVLNEGEEVPVDETAHVEKLEKVLKAATCTTTGIGKYVCELCEKNLGYKTIPADHVWDDGEVKAEATCGKDGEKLYTCTICGETKTEKIPATGKHDMVEDMIDATCTEPAKVGEKCTVCGAVGEAEVVEGSEALGHDLVLDEENEKYVAATCEEGGHDTFKCSRCDYTVEEDTKAMGHEWEDTGVVDADCENAAGVQQTCANCQATKVVPFEGDLAVPALGHKEVKDDIAPTCKDAGITGRIICSVCGKVLNEGEEVPADENAHVKAPGKVLKEATCSVAGTRKVVCDVCGKALGYESYYEDHNWSDEKVNNDGTCVYKYCLNCGEIEIISEFGEVKGCTDKHTIVEVSEVPATTESEGTTAGKKCAVCGEILEGCEVIPKITCTKHEAAEAVRENEVAATCTENGSYDEVVYCVNCGAEMNRETKTVEALGHQPETVEGKAATCTETGLTEGEKCSVCGEVLTAQKEIEMLPHTEEVIPGKAATTTEPGLTEGKKCSVCGTILVEQEVIPMIEEHEHAAETIEGKAATCTEEGLSDGEKCSICGEILKQQETIPALGHKAETIEGKAATCTEDGLTNGEKCSVCGEVLTAQETITALGHQKETVEGKAPTCTENGLTSGEKCSICGEVLTAQETIPAAGHKYTVSYSFNEDFTKRVITYTCTECGDSYSVEEEY